MVVAVNPRNTRNMDEAARGTNITMIATIVKTVSIALFHIGRTVEDVHRVDRDLWMIAIVIGTFGLSD